MDKVIIVTPVRGLPETTTVSLPWALSLMQMTHDPDIGFTVKGFSCDLVRARSRVVREVLDADRWSHVLWWDDDTVPKDLSIVRNMLSTGYDIVAAPYPRKRIHWDRAAAAALQGDNPEWGAYSYPIGLPDTAAPFHNGCTNVNHIGMGFMLTSTKALREMWDAYAPTLSFGDVVPGSTPKHTVALFQLVMPSQTPGPDGHYGPLLSEDYSFCYRARSIGIDVKMYCGPGSPVDHVGGHVYEGHTEGLVR